MDKKQAITCPQIWGGCGKTCVEVGHALSYPKPAPAPWPGAKESHEYRYTCPSCGKEWIFNPKWRDIYAIPRDARFHIKFVNGKEIIQTEDPEILEYWELPPGKLAELTPEQVNELDKEASRQRYERLKQKGG